MAIKNNKNINNKPIIKIKVDNSTVRIAVGLRLDAPIVSSHVCVRGKTVTVDGHHGLSRRFGSGRHSRHNQVNDLLCRAFINTDTLATRGPHSLCTRDNKRPDGVTLVQWKRGRCLAWDATCHIVSLTSKPAVSRQCQRRRRLKENRLESIPIMLLALTVIMLTNSRKADVLTERELICQLRVGYAPDSSKYAAQLTQQPKHII